MLKTAFFKILTFGPHSAFLFDWVCLHEKGIETEQFSFICLNWSQTSMQKRKPNMEESDGYCVQITADDKTSVNNTFQIRID